MYVGVGMNATIPVRHCATHTLAPLGALSAQILTLGEGAGPSGECPDATNEDNPPVVRRRACPRASAVGYLCGGDNLCEMNVCCLLEVVTTHVLFDNLCGDNLCADAVRLAMEGRLEEAAKGGRAEGGLPPLDLPATIT